MFTLAAAFSSSSFFCTGAQFFYVVCYIGEVTHG